MSLRFFLLVMSLVLLMTLYVWQNLEVVKMKIDYNKLYHKEKELIQQNDLIRLDIERERTMKKVRERSAGMNTETITPAHVTVIVPETKKNRGGGPHESR